MTMKMFRCMNRKCQGVKHPDLGPGGFMAETPLCPQCKIEANHPRFGLLIQRLVMIHYNPDSEVPGFGLGHRACDPSKEITAQLDGNGIPAPWHAGTGNPFVVNCPECKKTTAHMATVARLSDEDSVRDVFQSASDRLPVFPG